MKEKRCILWTTSISDLLNVESNRIGGISVQMFFWAEELIKNGWNVYSFYNGKNIKAYDTSKISFLKAARPSFITLFYYLFFALNIINKIKPELIICRGGTNRNLLFLSIICRLKGIKLVHFVASDRELVWPLNTFSDRFNMSLFHLGLKLCKYIIVQNDFQNKEFSSMCENSQIEQIRNIWQKNTVSIVNNKVSRRVLWVSNIKSLKRPLLFLNLASKFPDVTFTMIGADQEKELYAKCLEYSKQNKNIEFLGYQDFLVTNKYFSMSDIFICTSEFEGFPNTFLQAWSNSIPVISTVNPSNVITDNNLGCYCVEIPQIEYYLAQLLNNINLYNDIKDSIRLYFDINHSSESAYNKLIKFINI